MSWHTGGDTVKPTELEQLYGIYDRAFPEDAGEKWSREGFAEILGLEGVQVGVSVLDGPPAAIIILRVVLDEAEILTICSDPVHQGQGVASRLLGAATARMAQCGVRRMFLEVRASNDAALALYRAAGFQEDGSRQGYYSSRDGRREDARLMSLNISVAG